MSDPHSQPQLQATPEPQWFGTHATGLLSLPLLPSLTVSFSGIGGVTGDSLLIVIRQSAVYEGQYFEGGHEKNKPIRG